MSSRFKDITINGVATQTGAPTLANHLVRLTDVAEMLAGAGIGASGVKALTAGVAAGSVTGLGLAFTPTKCLLNVSIPEGGLLIEASVVGGLSTDGFNFALTGEPDTGDYELHYILLP